MEQNKANIEFKLELYRLKTTDDVKLKYKQEHEKILYEIKQFIDIKNTRVLKILYRANNNYMNFTSI